MEKESPVVRLSVMFSPNLDSERVDGSSPSPPAAESLKKQNVAIHSPQQSPDMMENPRTLLMLLRQRDLEIMALKNANRRDPSERLGCILQELVKTRQKLPPRRSPKEEGLQAEVDQLSDELKTIKKSHEKEIKVMEDKLAKTKMQVMYLQKEARTPSRKMDDESDTESSTSLDEGAKLACECFELWSETGTKVTSETSDLRLRRIPKHTSFVDAFHKFGSISLSEEEKDEIILKLEKAHICALDGSSQESSPSEPSSLAVLTSQKSDIFSAPDTKTIESSSFNTAPSSEKMPMAKSNLKSDFQLQCFFLEVFISFSLVFIHMPYEYIMFQLLKALSLDHWSLAQSGLTLGQLSEEEMYAHFLACPFVEECRRCHIGSGPLRIVSVHNTGKFVRIFNTLLNKEIDLSGYVIQQWVKDFPVSVYRFPNGTILPAQHHITVWAAGANLAHEQASNMPLSGPNFFRTGPECTTCLYDHHGQTISQYRGPQHFMAAADAYSDNVDLSVDKFPLSEDDETFESLPSRPEVASSQRNRRTSGILVNKRFHGHFSFESAQSSKVLLTRTPGVRTKISDASSETSSAYSVSSKSLLPLIGRGANFSANKALCFYCSLAAKNSNSSTSEGDFACQTWQPQIMEPEAREFKTTLDTTLPMVSLIGQRSARSRYGFKHMTYMPTITDLHLRRYCPAR
ncbi:lamin tail domain-containing protein 2 [Lacerta agilis]|uniref:lamin tail domain-containing protein 2 n=1 Tax=Lacerta agilis TaxID=80427 RepID=UPI0014193C61|nr:lamin tail domain-containing protein 2 [Lacerta agilis]